MAVDPNPQPDDAMTIDMSEMRAMWAEQAVGDWSFNAQFFIISAAPGSGKTPFLQACAAAFKDKGLRVGGVLCPTDSGTDRRVFELLQSEQTLKLQLNDGKPGDGSGCTHDAAGDAPEGAVGVGNFLFDEQVLASAREELRSLRGEERGIASAPADWVFVDEIGPLELKRGGGLEPVIGDLLRAAARGELGPPQSRFLIVVRPSLRDEVVSRYGLDGTGCAAPDEDEEGPFPGFGGADARAAAVVNLDVPAQGEAAEELIQRLAGLPPLL